MRWKPLLILILLLATIPPVAWADKLSPERLLERAMRHWPPEFREANSKALVAAYIILRRPLEQLEGKAREAIERYGTHELWNAVVAGRQGDYIDICYRPPKVESIFIARKGHYLDQLSDNELLEIALRGHTPQERQVAATLLVRRAIEGVGVRISSWYAFRLAYEHTKFDPLKLKLQGWMWWSEQAPELAAATITPLAQMYLAEHFVWWEWERGGRGRYHEIIQGQLECPELSTEDGDMDGTEGRGGGQAQTRGQSQRRSQNRSQLKLDWPLFRRDLARTGMSPGRGRITAPRQRWAFPARGLVESSPAAGDIDNDGRLEVVIGSYGGQVYALDGETGRLEWSFTTTEREWVLASPALGDVDGDGGVEVAIGGSDQRLYLLDGRTGRLVWSFAARAKVWSSAALADLNGDGRLEVIFGADQVYALDGRTGRPLWTFSLEVGTRSSPAIGDLDGDGKLEVVIGSTFRVQALSSDGHLLWSFPKGPEEISSTALADLDGDGQLEVIVGISKVGLYLLEGLTGRPRWLFPIARSIRSSPAIGDLDGDGFQEVVIGSNDHHVYAVDGRSGRPRWSFTAGGLVESSPAIGDIDGDGKLEVLIGSHDGRLYCLDGATGRKEWEFRAGGQVFSSPALADLDGDGELEVVFGCNNGRVYALDG